MRKRVDSFTKGILTFAAIFGMSFFTGCGSDETVTPPFSGTIYDLIKDTKFKQSATVTADKALDSLVKYIQLSPSLVSALSGSTPYTFFAPSNLAFANLLATPGFPSKIADINPSLITGVFSYHIVGGALTKAQLTPTGTGAGLATLYSDTNPCTGSQTPQVIKVNANGTLLTGSTNAEIQIVVGDNKTTGNGVMHVVGSVMIPPSIGASLTPILGKHTATILLGSSFKYLAAVMTKADCGITNPNDVPLSSMLASTGPFTVFLIPDAVFEGTAAQYPGGAITVTQLIAGFSAAQWRGILLNHIVAGTNNLSALTAGTQLTTLAGDVLFVADVPVSAQTPKGKVLLVNGDPNTASPIFVSDLAVSNGVDHVIGRILFP